MILDEVREAMRSTKRSKAGGEDGLVREMLETTDEFGVRKTPELNRIYESGYIPEAMGTAVCGYSKKRQYLEGFKTSTQNHHEPAG